MKWFEVKNQTNASAELYFYGDIVGDDFERWSEEDVCPSIVVSALKECTGKDLNVYINSGGGSVFAGIAIYNLLKRHNGKKTVYVDGLAASIASIIAMAGDEIIMPGNAYLMIHKPSCGSWGDTADGLRKLADLLDDMEETIIKIYESKLAAGADIETIRQMVKAETWLTGEQAKEYFNITVEVPVKAVACASKFFDKYEKTPPKLQAAEEPQQEQPEDTTQSKMDSIETEISLVESFIFGEKEGEKR